MTPGRCPGVAQGQGTSGQVSKIRRGKITSWGALKAPVAGQMDRTNVPGVSPAMIMQPVPLICRDPQDNKIEDLLVLKEYAGIKIVSADDYLKGLG